MLTVGATFYTDAAVAAIDDAAIDTAVGTAIELHTGPFGIRISEARV
jgi:hypothetical protein